MEDVLVVVVQKALAADRLEMANGIALRSRST